MRFVGCLVCFSSPMSLHRLVVAPNPVSTEDTPTTHGGRVFYDLNANSNLRRPIGEFFGFDPFERLVDFLVAQLDLVSA